MLHNVLAAVNVLAPLAKTVLCCLSNIFIFHVTTLNFQHASDSANVSARFLATEYFPFLLQTWLDTKWNIRIFVQYFINNILYFIRNHGLSSNLSTLEMQTVRGLAPWFSSDTLALYKSLTHLLTYLLTSQAPHEEKRGFLATLWLTTHKKLALP